MPYHHDWEPGSSWVVMLVLMLLFLTLLVGAIVLAVRATRRPLGGA
jgi:hypothetical protein